MNAYETALQDAEALRRNEHGNFMGTTPSPSQRPKHRLDLVRETQIRWEVPEAVVRRLPWVRERFGRLPRSQRGLMARSVDARGRTVRYWISKEEDRDAYARMLRAGDATCPLEAIWPPSITAGQPAQPAHPHLLPLLWQAIAAEEGTPVALPTLQPDPEAEAQKLLEIERAFWVGLRPDPEVASHG